MCRVALKVKSCLNFLSHSGKRTARKIKKV
jgi:hypothetical protein